MTSHNAPSGGRRPADWADALLTSGTEALLEAVRNYLGPVRTPYDKRELARRLEAFVRRAETRDSMLSLLDGLDARILGTCLIAGPASEQELKDLFVGELPLFELGIRLANLLDRLLLYRYADGSRRLIAVNPLLEAELRARLADPATVFGAVPRGAPAAGLDAAAVVALFSLLLHAPASLRKGGALTKRASERAVALFRGMGPDWAEGAADRLDAAARALARAGVLRPEGESWSADRAAFSSLLEEWGEGLPFLLAALLAPAEGGRGEDEGPEGEEQAGRASAVERAAPLGRLLEGAHEALPAGCVLPRPGLARWLRLTAWLEAGRSYCGRGPRLDATGDPARAIPALEALGIAAARPATAAGEAGDGAWPRPGGGAVLVAEGAHALHLMPEAELAARLLVGSIARPVSLGKVWSFELDRESARAGFAGGIDAARARARLEELSGRPLPQSLAFSLRAWDEEYRSLRLYRGLVLVADERLRPVVEGGIASGALEAERLAPGAYFLRARGAEEAAAQLARAGLEAPPELSVASPPEAPAAAAGPRGARRADDALRDLAAAFGASAAPPPALDPEPRLASLREALAASGRGSEESRELGDRIERRLVLTAEQIARADPRPERMEAGGLDYLGKVRVVERALRSQGDRLELLYRLPGAEPVRALLRPVRLDRNDKGLVLEAEDLATGGPARVPLGAVSTVRRVRASLFGEEQ